MDRTAARVASLPLLLALSLVIATGAPAAGHILLPPPVRLPLLHGRPGWNPDPGAAVALLPPPLRWGGLWAVPASAEET